MKVHDKKCSSNNFMLPFMRIVKSLLVKTSFPFVDTEILQEKQNLIVWKF